ncbi:hypothetical protein, partial [Frankia sp. AgKG'84/4]|uniref:hypothetical protein n=1 Tax=Frankia sp. AgKG'84/4 TaxID=573490 RepID=UPI00202A2ABA
MSTIARNAAASDSPAAVRCLITSGPSPTNAATSRHTGHTAQAVGGRSWHEQARAGSPGARSSP